MTLPAAIHSDLAWSPFEVIVLLVRAGEVVAGPMEVEEVMYGGNET